MKRLLPLLLLAACGPSEPVNPAMTLNYGSIDQLQLSVYVIDSCEYIGHGMDKMASFSVLTHKGNCRFCAARAAAEDTVVVNRPQNADPNP